MTPLWLLCKDNNKQTRAENLVYRYSFANSISVDNAGPSPCFPGEKQQRADTDGGFDLSEEKMPILPLIMEPFLQTFGLDSPDSPASTLLDSLLNNYYGTTTT